MASSLPRKMASSGTAAASTSITLLVFSSTSVDNSKVARSMVMVKMIDCPARATPRRIICRLPAACSVTTRSIGVGGRRRVGGAQGGRASRVVDEELQPVRDIAVGLGRAGQHRMIERAAKDRGIAAALSASNCLRLHADNVRPARRCAGSESSARRFRPRAAGAIGRARPWWRCRQRLRRSAEAPRAPGNRSPIRRRRRR